MGKSRRPIERTHELTPQDANLIGRNRAARISREEHQLLRRCYLSDGFMLYLALALYCDLSTGIVEEVTYEILGRFLLDEDQNPASPSRVRVGLLELDDIGLITFDRLSPTSRAGTLGIAMPHQVAKPPMVRRSRRGK